MITIGKIKPKLAVISELWILIILANSYLLFHELGHVLAIKMLGGEVDTFVVNIFDPTQSYVLYMFPYSNFHELYQTITKLFPHLLLGVLGFYLCHRGANKIRITSAAPGKCVNILLGWLYVGIGTVWFLPFRYITILPLVRVKPYLQLDVTQAVLHFSNFASLYLPTVALFLSKFSIEFQVGELILGLTGLSGLIYFVLMKILHRILSH